MFQVMRDRSTEKTMKTQKPIIDADTEQATRNETRVRAQPEIIIAEEIEEWLNSKKTPMNESMR